MGRWGERERNVMNVNGDNGGMARKVGNVHARHNCTTAPKLFLWAVCLRGRNTTMKSFDVCVVDI